MKTALFCIAGLAARSLFAAQPCPTLPAPDLRWLDPPKAANGACLILIADDSEQNRHAGSPLQQWQAALTTAGFQCVHLVSRPSHGAFSDASLAAWENGRCAVRLVRQAAKDRGFDPERIGAVGIEPGDNLVCLLAANALSPTAARAGETNDVPCHLNWAIANAPATGGAPLAFDAKACPTCLFLDGADLPAPNDATLLYRELRKRKIPGELHLTPGRTTGADAPGRALEFMRQMNFDSRLGPNLDLIARYASDDARASYEKKPIWPAGETPDVQTNQCTPYLEWHLPKELKTTAIQIIFSGGSYRENDTESFEVAPMRRYLNGKGMTVVTLKYRTPRPLGASAKHLSAWQDLQRTIRLVRDEAAARGLDPNRIGIMGSSAGGHLALLGATSARTPAYAAVDARDRLPCNVQWAIAVYPAYVFASGRRGDKEPDGCDLRTQLVPEFAFDADSCPVCFLHGDEDICPVMNSVTVWEKLRSLGIACDLHTLATRNHCFQAHAAVGTGSYTWMERVWDFLAPRVILPTPLGGAGTCP